MCRQVLSYIQPVKSKVSVFDVRGSSWDDVLTSDGAPGMVCGVTVFPSFRVGSSAVPDFAGVHSWVKGGFYAGLGFARLHFQLSKATGSLPRRHVQSVRDTGRMFGRLGFRLVE